MATEKNTQLLTNGIHQQLIAKVGRSLTVKVLMLIALWSLSRCAPMICDMQSACLVGKHNVEITPGVTSVQFAQERKAEVPAKTTGQFIGIQAAYGVSDKIDLRLRVEHLQYGKESTTLVSIGPKFSLVKDRIAFYVPVWCLGLKPVMTAPTCLFTIPVVKNRIEFNPAVKNILSMGGYDCNSGLLVGWKVGFGISTDLSKWAIRPEYGVVYNINEKSKYGNFSIGMSLNMSRLFGK